MCVLLYVTFSLGLVKTQTSGIPHSHTCLSEGGGAGGARGALGGVPGRFTTRSVVLPASAPAGGW